MPCVFTTKQVSLVDQRRCIDRPTNQHPIYRSIDHTMDFDDLRRRAEGLHANHAQDIFAWYSEIPVISRFYLTTAVMTTTACFMDFVSPLTLYYNYDLVLNKHQYWRLFSSFLFFGSFSLDFIFHLYFVVRYCRLLEEGVFRGRTADFVFMILFGAALMLIFAVNVNMFAKIKFLGHPLAFMMVYLWARSPEQRHVRMNLIGVLPFNAPFLPWVLLLFSLFLGNSIEADFLGIIVGHIYYFFDQVYPKVALIRNWSIRKIIVTPAFIHFLCGSLNARNNVNNVNNNNAENVMNADVLGMNNNNNNNNNNDVNQ